MAICIIASQVAVIDPEDALGKQLFLQACLNLCFREGLVTMRCQPPLITPNV